MHFLTIVIGDEPEEQLEGYQENNSGNYPEGTDLQNYVEFFDVEEGYREHYKIGVFAGEHEKKEHPERYLRPIREVFLSFEDYMAEVYGERDPKSGRYGDWWNPNSQFDWYQFGGRWTGHLILKPGRAGRVGTPGVFTPPAGPGRADQARKGDIDFQGMERECFEDLMRDWDRLEERGKSSDPRERRNHDIPAHCLTREEFEQYARQRARHWAPSAVVHRGEWFGPWWVSDEPTAAAAEKWDAWFSSLLASAPDDTLLTVVDCHA
jgi:hypothetical protein